MNKLVILRGLPASGKSTYAKNLVDNEGYKRVNKDDIRMMVDNGKWSKQNEDIIFKIEKTLIICLIGTDNNVVVDDTNLNPKVFNSLKELHDNVEIVDFKTSVLECIRRDKLREKSVGEEVIRGMNNKYKYAENGDLKKAIICDIDGTIAIKGDRDIYDYTKVHLDTVNLPIFEILKNLPHNIDIIFCSGRDDACSKQTAEWLQNNVIKPIGRDMSWLLMRKTGDKRKDSIVKEEIYNNTILGIREILFVLDDRQQVVDMWRSKGLTCLQVAKGDF